MPLNPSNTLRGVNLPSQRPVGGSRAAAANTTNSRPSASRPASATKSVSHILGGKTGGGAHHHHHQSASGQLSAQEHQWFDKYHKLYEEHMQVKQERKEQDQRLTDITTKFRRITRDLKLSGFNQTEASSAADEVLEPYKREIQHLKEKLQSVTAERDHARGEAAELRKLLGMRPSSSSGTNNNRNNNTSVPRGSSTSVGRGNTSGIVDVTSLLNQRSNNNNNNNNGTTAAADNTSASMDHQHHQTSSADIQKLRNALSDEISKNDRLSQHCENLRAQLAVTSSSSSKVVSSSNNHNSNINNSNTATPSRGMNNNNSNGNSAVLQSENKSLRDDVNHLSNQVSDFRNAVDALQREKQSLEQEIRFLKQNGNQNHAVVATAPHTSTHHNNNGTSSFSPSANQHSSATPLHQHQHHQHHQQHQYHQQHQNQNQNQNTLQQLSQDLSAQVSHLSQRLDHSQNQVQSLRGECERLLQELKQSHEDVAQARKKTFETEQEVSSLRVKAARNEELESALGLKTSELLRCEQELLRLVDKLQTCSRETESQVRLEYSARLSDVDALRDEAERARRSRERELFNAQQDLAEAKREVESKKSDIEHLNREVQKLNQQNQELLNSKHSEKMQSTRDASDAQLVQQAVASMMMSTPGGGGSAANNNNINNGTGTTTTGGNNNNNSNDWNDMWELQQLREQAAQAILDREMAEQRASDFENAVGRKNSLMEEMIEERDQLLYENLELRRRLSGVQTCFTKAPSLFQNHLQTGTNLDKNTNTTLVRAATAATAAGSTNSSSSPFSAVMVTLTSVSLNMQNNNNNSVGGGGGLHIASLDGIEGFECGISDPFAVLADGSPTGPSVELPFRFSNIPHDDHTLAQLRESFFNLQIHQVRDGAKSNLVAIARLPAGQSIAACLENGTTTSKIDLHGSDGSLIGNVNVTISVDSAALPLALLPPVDAKSSPGVRLGFSSPSTDPDSMRALLLAMRSIRGVRIQIIRCSNLKNTADPNRVPTPYVFYTSSLERTTDWPLAHIITDTAVHTRTRAVTCDPVFDCEPKDFIFRVFDQQVAAFFRHAKLSFVVYDINCENPEQNLGMASVSLEPMLQSVNSSMIENDVSLGQSGTISFTISWIR